MLLCGIQITLQILTQLVTNESPLKSMPNALEILELFVNAQNTHTHITVYPEEANEKGTIVCLYDHATYTILATPQLNYITQLYLRNPPQNTLLSPPTNIKHIITFSTTSLFRHH